MELPSTRGGCPHRAAAPKGLWGCSPASVRRRRHAPRPASVSRRLAHHLRRRSARKPLFSHVVRRLVAATKTQGDDHASSATMLGLGRARHRRDSVDVDVDKLKCRNVTIGPEDRRAMRPATRRSTWHRRRARGWASRDGARRVRAGTEANWGSFKKCKKSNYEAFPRSAVKRRAGPKYVGAGPGGVTPIGVVRESNTQRLERFRSPRFLCKRIISSGRLASLPTPIDPSPRMTPPTSGVGASSSAPIRGKLALWMLKPPCK